MDLHSFSKMLWQLPTTRRYARNNLLCPFVAQLAEGTLPSATFTRYVAQDAYFLRSFQKSYTAAGDSALAAGLGEAIATEFSALATGVEEELKLHAQYASSLGIDLAAATPLPSCAAYCAFLDQAGTTAENKTVHNAAQVVKLCAAMAPCMRLYAFLGKAIEGMVETAAPETATAHPYRKWIDEYASDDFEALATKLEDLLDQALSAALTVDSSDPPPEGDEALPQEGASPEEPPLAEVAEALYVEAMRHELQFFQGAYDAVPPASPLSVPAEPPCAQLLLAAARIVPPRVLIVAGSDSGGGAGIQADMKACAAAGVFSTKTSGPES